MKSLNYVEFLSRRAGGGCEGYLAEFTAVTASYNDAVEG